MFFKVNTFFFNLFTFFDKKNIFFIGIIFFIPFIAHSQALPKNESTDVFYGKASYYDEFFNGRKTANGEIFSHTLLTAAHPSWPFNTKVKITNLVNNNTVVVRINDRGPFVKGRCIDVSKQAAKVLGFLNSGVVEVKMEVLKWGARKDTTNTPMLIAKNNSKKTVSATNNKRNGSPSKVDSTSKIIATTKTQRITDKTVAVNKKKSEKKEIKPNSDSTTTASLPKTITENKRAQSSKSTSKPKEKSVITLCTNSDSLSGWCVQIGSYGSKANAERTVQAVTEITREWVCIQEIYRNDVTLYRVVCGKNIENSRAYELKQLLAKKYPDAFVTNFITLMNSAGLKK